MSKLTQEPLNDPYQELMLKTLVYALAHLPRTHAYVVLSDGLTLFRDLRYVHYSGQGWKLLWPWLTLETFGRCYLEGYGFTRGDIKLAINAGVRRGLILRKIVSGFPAIALKRLVQS